MGMTLEQLLAEAESFKESLWYYMEVNNKEDQKIKDKMNELLDMLDSIRDLEP